MVRTVLKKYYKAQGMYHNMGFISIMSGVRLKKTAAKRVHKYFKNFIKIWKLGPC